MAFEEEQESPIQEWTDVESDGAESTGNRGRKRTYHNILEKKRRNHIKDGYFKLRNSIPHIEGNKLSRIQILKQAVEHITSLKEEIEKKEEYCLELRLRIQALSDVQEF